MLPATPLLLEAALAGDAGAIAIVAILVGIVLGLAWALWIRDPSVNRRKYG